MNLSPPDILIFSILIFFAIIGYNNGFIKELSLLLSISISLFLTNYFHKDLLILFGGYLQEYGIPENLFFILLFTVFTILISIILSILKQFLDFSIIKWIDKLLGISFGLIKGILYISITLFLLKSLNLNYEFKNKITDKLSNDSYFYQLFIKINNDFISKTDLNQSN